MKIKIQVLGLPALSQALGNREIELDMPGGTVTVQSIIDHLVQKFGQPIRKALYDQQGTLDSTVQIALNGKKFIPHNRLDTPLTGGDTLTFMLLMAGGAKGSTR